MTRFFYIAVILICACVPVFAQTDDNPFLLKRGDNEFGFWAGFSPKATTIFEGLREDEASGYKSTFKPPPLSSLANFIDSVTLSLFHIATITSAGEEPNPSGNMFLSFITTRMRSSPRENPHAGISCPRNIPTRLS